MEALGLAFVVMLDGSKGCTLEFAQAFRPDSDEKDEAPLGRFPAMASESEDMLEESDGCGEGMPLGPIRLPVLLGDI